MLLIDAGNSRLKWVELEQGRLSELTSSPYSSEDKVQDLVGLLRERPQDALICSVLGPAAQQLIVSWAKQGYEHVIDFFTPSSTVAHGVRIAYKEPERFGADRLAALIGAHKHYPCSCIIADCGTALTLDALTADGEHIGGLILPGLGLMRASLTACTAGIGVGRSAREDKLLTQNTADAVYSGTLSGIVAALDRISGDMAMELATPPMLILTGGDAGQLAPKLTDNWTIDPLLVFKGLAVIAGAQ